MKVFEYQRVSTGRQNEAQQHNSVEEYCRAHSLQIYRTVTDTGVSGCVSYKDRALADLLEQMSEGDMLIVSEISRLGRSMSDLSKLISDELKPRKLRLVAVKNGISLNCHAMSAVDEFIINALAFCSQIERDMIRQRTASSLDVIKNDIETKGYHITKKGKRITALGNPDAVNNGSVEKANRASCESKKEKARNNPNNILFAKLLKTWRMNNPMFTSSSCGPFVDLLNEWNARTSTGLPFNESRCWSMYCSLKRQGIV